MPPSEDQFDVHESRHIPFKLTGNPITVKIVTEDPDTVALVVEDVPCGQFYRRDHETNFEFAARVRAMLKMVDAVIERLGWIEPQTPPPYPLTERTVYDCGESTQ